MKMMEVPFSSCSSFISRRIWAWMVTSRAVVGSSAMRILSGSGKSVSAMSILRLLDANGYIDSGEIIFEGKDLTKLPMEDMYHIRAVVGSSAMRILGRQARAMAIITRWRMPPDSWWEYWLSTARRDHL